MNILEKITAYKREETAKRKNDIPVEELRKLPLYSRRTLSLVESLQQKNGRGIIAEFKRRSPSKGLINGTADVRSVTAAYAKFGAAGLSVLTDEHFFGGSTEDLLAARNLEIPILRKDFILEDYQLVEARAMGADVILLIAACLTPHEVQQLASYAKALQMEVLLEIHGEEELEHICEAVDIVGVNNRDLKTFSVDLNRSIALSRRIPAGKPIIAESGINDVETITRLQQNGFSGFLIGEYFMKSEDPAIAFASFVQQLNHRPSDTRV